MVKNCFHINIIYQEVFIIMSKHTDKDCIFCKIIAGEIPSRTVYEDDDYKAILDVSPASKGHVIILPKNHAEDIFHCLMKI